MKLKWFLLIPILSCPLASYALDDRPRLVIDTGGHTAKIRDVMFTHDGRYLVSAGYDKAARVWDVQTGQTVRTLRGEVGDGPAGEIYAAALSPDDRYLAMGGHLAGAEKKDISAIRIHDFQTGKVVGLLRGHNGEVLDLAFSRDGLHLVSGGVDRTVRLWDTKKRRQLKVLEGHRDPVWAVAFSPDGQRAVSGSEDSSLRLWDAKRGALIRVMESHQGPIYSVAFSPDGRYIASGESGCCEPHHSEKYEGLPACHASCEG